MEIPETRYASTSDGVHIAYQVVGDGPGDLVFVPGFVFNVEQTWEWPQMARFARRLASFARLILFDRRGTGLSDHIVPQETQLTLEARMDDIRAVMDDARSERAALFGFEEGFGLCAMFAATYPDRVSALVAFAPAGLGLRDAERPWALSQQGWDEYLEDVRHGWGTLAFAEEEGKWVWPDVGEDAEWFRQYATWMRRSVGPGDAVAFLEIDSKLDVRDVLPTVRTPTLVVQRIGDQAISIEYGRYVAQQIAGAVLVELPGSNHGYMAPDQDEVLDQIERFSKALRDEEAELDRVLATVLFTDIVGSTERASELGDRSWKDLLERHHRAIRGLLARYRGREVDTAGDGFFATFDGPARAVRCAQQIVDAVRPLDLQIRAGLHTGECETIDGKVGGLGVVIGSRVGGLAGPSEVLVSSTVKDLTAGSGLVFEDRGEHELKGVPDRWRLYRVVSE
ncbi:MAG TPA: adenylate/guanylate cyclase domain-containing protein [Actinomycetota bacterium]